MVPLGPLNGKNFGTTISPWIITPDALEPFKTSGPVQATDTPAHLEAPDTPTYAIDLKVEILSNGTSTVTCESKLHTLYWTVPQMIAHLVTGGCGLRTGDIVATGTVSGFEKGTHGCLLETTEGGRNPLRLTDGTTRTYLQDGDVVIMTATAGGKSSGVGFGECAGKILASKPAM
jgi:fumarylacetoacetase